MVAQHGSVVVCRRDYEHHSVGAAVPPLRLATALESLDVVQSCLRVNADGSRSVKSDIPRSEIAVASDGNLRLPPKARMHLRSEALQ
jgi:hypothetical protein